MNLNLIWKIKSFPTPAKPAGVEAECHARIECKCRVFADIERCQRMTAFDRTGLRGVPNLQRRHDLAASKDLDTEFFVDYWLTGWDMVSTLPWRVSRLFGARCQPP